MLFLSKMNHSTIVSFEIIPRDKCVEGSSALLLRASATERGRKHTSFRRAKSKIKRKEENLNLPKPGPERSQIFPSKIVYKQKCSYKCQWRMMRRNWQNNLSLWAWKVLKHMFASHRIHEQRWQKLSKASPESSTLAVGFQELSLPLDVFDAQRELCH